MNYVSALTISGFGAGFFRAGEETGSEKQQKGRGKVYLINQRQSSRSASGDCYNTLGIIAQAIQLIFPPLPKDKAEPNTALKINICWGRASRILLNASCVRRGIPKILGTQVTAEHTPMASISPSAINYPELILA